MPAIAITVAVAWFLAIRLGPSLVGSRVFLGVDVLRMYEPWSFANDHPVTSFWYGTDHIDGMIPSLREIHRRFLHGDWASWSNLSLAGTPLLSVPDLAVLTPGRWLYLLLPTALAPGWSKFFELAFAATFTYLLVRRLNGSKVAAALAGVIYPLTGFMIGWNNYPQVAVGSVIPMLFWAVERYLQQPRVRAAIPVAAASALLMFGGFPAVAGQTFYFAGGYAVVRVVGANHRRLRDVCARLGWLGGAFVVGIGLSAFQLLPFAEQRLSGVNLAYRAPDFFNHTPYVAALSSVFPKTFGTNVRCCSYSPQDVYTYIGAVVAFLAVLGVIQAVSGRVQREAGGYFVGAIVGVLVLIWFQGWWTNWMNHLPIFHGNPIGRIRSQLGVPVAVLAASGFDFLHSRRWSPGWWRRGIPESPVVAAAAATAVCALVGFFGWVLATRGYPWVPPTLAKDATAAIAPVAVIGVLAAASRFRVANTALLIVVPIAVVAQAFIATSYFWPTAARSGFYPSAAPIRFVQAHQGHDRIATTGYTMRANVTAFYGLRTFNGHAFLDPDVKRLILGIDPTALLGPTYTAYTTAVNRVLPSPGLDRMGVRYLVCGVDDALPGTRSTPVPIPGAADPLAGKLGTLELQPGRMYRTQIDAGSLRGINVPLTAARATRITVTVRGRDGSTVASDTRPVTAGRYQEPVPLADDPGTPITVDPTTKVTVELSVDAPGVTVTTNAAGRIRVQPVRPPAPGDGSRLAYAGSGLVVWERLHYLPRIRWASRANVIPNDAARLNAVAKRAVQPGSVILAQQPRAPLDDTGGRPTDLEITRDDGDTTAVTVHAESPGYVVIADSIQKDFVATVDGRSTPIVSADYVGGALFVPPGTHRVSVDYHPAGRNVGGIISGVSAGLLLLAAVPPACFARLRRRRATSQGAG